MAMASESFKLKTITSYEIDFFSRNEHLPPDKSRCLLLAEALKCSSVRLMVNLPNLREPMTLLKKEVTERLIAGDSVRVESFRSSASLILSFDAVPDWHSYLVKSPADLLNPHHQGVVTGKTRQELLSRESRGYYLGGSNHERL